MTRPHARGDAIGVVAFPGSGISANLADTAKAHGIPAWRFSEPPPAGKGGGA